MKSNIHKDRETRRKQTLENANSKEVRGLQRNAEIWNNGHEAGTQHGIELTVFELMKGLSKKYPEFDNLLGSHWDIPEVTESIISVFEEVNSQNENPDAGMEERERLMAEGKDD
jgi:hypothetical protein